MLQYIPDTQCWPMPWRPILITWRTKRLTSNETVVNMCLWIAIKRFPRKSARPTCCYYGTKLRSKTMMASSGMMFIPSFTEFRLIGRTLLRVQQPAGRHAQTWWRQKLRLAYEITKEAYTQNIAEYSAFFSACKGFSNSHLFLINFVAISM